MPHPIGAKANGHRAYRSLGLIAAIRKSRKQSGPAGQSPLSSSLISKALPRASSVYKSDKQTEILSIVYIRLNRFGLP